jgi:hypothetical protein
MINKRGVVTEGDSGPESATGKPARNATVSPGSVPGSGQESGRPSAGETRTTRNRNGNTRLTDTLSNLPGDLGSIGAVWTGRPESIHHMIKVIVAARDNDDRAVKTAAAWSILVIIPRTILHLLSWILGDPFRTLLVAGALAITTLV